MEIAAGDGFRTGPQRIQARDKLRRGGVGVNLEAVLAVPPACGEAVLVE